MLLTVILLIQWMYDVSQHMTTYGDVYNTYDILIMVVNSLCKSKQLRQSKMAEDYNDESDGDDHGKTLDHDFGPTINVEFVQDLQQARTAAEKGIHCQVGRLVCFCARMALLLSALMLQQQALAKVSTFVQEERFLAVTSSYNWTNETSPQLLRDLPDYMEVNGEEPGENHTASIAMGCYMRDCAKMPNTQSYQHGENCTAIIATGCYMRDCVKMPNTQSHQDSTTEYPRKLKTQVLSKEQLLLPIGLSILDEEFVKNVVG